MSYNQVLLLELFFFFLMFVVWEVGICESISFAVSLVYVGNAFDPLSYSQILSNPQITKMYEGINAN